MNRNLVVKSKRNVKIRQLIITFYRYNNISSGPDGDFMFNPKSIIAWHFFFTFQKVFGRGHLSITP